MTGDQDDLPCPGRIEPGRSGPNGLLIDPAMAGRLRRLPAAISYSSYTPLEDEFAIEEA